MEHWLKRYLGLFFNFEEFGIFNWLAIPLFIYFVATRKKRGKWEISIALVFFLSCLFLSIKGVGYPRYLLTLYPFTIAAIFLYSWEFIKNRSRNFQISMLMICLLAVFFNFYFSREAYHFIWRNKIGGVDDYFPHGLIKFINDSRDFKPDSTTLVCSHRHLFFYYTDKKGIDFRDPKLETFNRQENKKQALDLLKNQLKVRYILLNWDFKPKRILYNIILNDCELVYQDEGSSLYMLREKELLKEDLDKLFVNDSLLRNGSFENWNRGPQNNPDFFEGGDNIFEGMVIREDKEVKVGRYSAKITGDNFNFTQVLDNIKDLGGKKLTCFAWMKTNVPDKYRIQIDGGFKTRYSKRHSGRGNWELLQTNLTVNPLADSIIARVIQAEKTGGTDDVVYMDGALLLEGDWNTFYLYRLHMEKNEAK